MFNLSILYNPQSRQKAEAINIKSENTNTIIGVNFKDIGVSDISDDKSRSSVYLEDIISIGTVPIKVNISNV